MLCETFLHALWQLQDLEMLDSNVTINLKFCAELVDKLLQENGGNSPGSISRSPLSVSPVSATLDPSLAKDGVTSPDTESTLSVN